ncbi:MAG: hypothetical protein V7K97_00355 [Nostoc sp.]|uniref:hypothetical protein n=1 Tax=Nostoc sp. TaxID=1180 RepID=UPI002FF977E0
MTSVLIAARRWEKSGVVMRSPGMRWWYSRCSCFSWLDFRPWRFPKIVSIGVFDQLNGPPNPYMSILQQGLGSYLSPLRDALAISSRWVFI